MRQVFFIRIILGLVLLGFHLAADGQEKSRVLFSGLILDQDSVPLSNVAIINPRSGKTVRTDAKGYFQTRIQRGDSLLVYHIAFQKMFINGANNGKILVLSPESNQIQSVEVVADSGAKRRQIDSLETSIVKIAARKKLEGYDKVPASVYFYRQNGSHDKAFSPYFGPTLHLDFEQLALFFSRARERKQIQKITGGDESKNKANPEKK